MDRLNDVGTELSQRAYEQQCAERRGRQPANPLHFNVQPTERILVFAAAAKVIDAHLHPGFGKGTHDVKRLLFGAGPSKARGNDCDSKPSLVTSNTQSTPSNTNPLSIQSDL